MTEQLQTGEGFQSYLDEITQDEIRHFPDMVTDGDKVAYLWDQLYEHLGVKDVDQDSEEIKKRKEAQRAQNLAKVIGIRQDQFPQVFQNGMPDEKHKKRLERSVAFMSLFIRIFEDPEVRSRNLNFPHPQLHGKSPIQALIAGNTDQALYFAAMSATHQDLV
jgi:hypothetical protein